MGTMEDGWKRIVRNLADAYNKLLYNAYASLEADQEDLGTVAVNTWVSPSNVTLFGGLQPKNFLYGNGSLTYTGTKPIRITVESIQSVTVSGGANATAEITNGVNGVPCTRGIMPASSAFGGAIPLHTTCTFEIQPGDTLDTFTRQTSESGGANITILRGVYTILTVDVLE